LGPARGEESNAVTDTGKILEQAKTVVVVDWPSRDVPDSLARAGYVVIVKGGPEPDNFSTYGLRDGEVVATKTGHAPDQADLVYAHRPLGELSGIVEWAKRLGAKAVWHQSGLAENGAAAPKGTWVPQAEAVEARRLVESAGLEYVDDVYIADAVRQR
jgi:predicted CoA-binding protein